MKRHLAYQKSLMEQALSLQKEMEHYGNVYGSIDFKYAETKIAECRERYAEVMTLLVKHFTEITRLMPAQQNVVTIAEEVYA